MSSEHARADSRDRCLAIVEATTALGGGVVDRPESELRALSRALAARCTTGSGLHDDVLIAEALALYVESSRRAGGRSYSHAQLFAAAAMCIGVVPELSTGANGSAGMAAYWYSLLGQGVHLLLADDYLAQRERFLVATVMTNLDRTVALPSDGMSDSERRRCYLADITVASYTRFMDDFLRERLPIAGFEPIQRSRHVCVVVDGSSVALGRAAERRAIFAPVADVPHIVRCRSQWDLDRATARVLRVGGIDIQDGIVHFNSKGITSLAEELGVSEFSSDFIVAAKEICRKLRPPQMTSTDDEIPYLDIALFAYLRKYDVLTCTLWSASEDAADLQKLYGLSSVRLREEKASAAPGLPVWFVNPAQRLDTLVNHVERASSAGVPVVVRTLGPTDEQACEAALAARGIDCALVRPGHEFEGFAQSRSPDTVTIIESGATMPESLDAGAVTELAAAYRTLRAGLDLVAVDPHDIIEEHRASLEFAGEAIATGSGRILYVAIGADATASFLDWCRMASNGDEAWILVCDDDPLLRALDSELLTSLHRLSRSFDSGDPDKHRARTGAALYRHAQTITREDRLVHWAFRSIVEKHAEVFYELQNLIATAPVRDVLERLVDESGDDMSSSDLDARSKPFVRDIMLYGIADMWCRFLSAASFLRLYLTEAYPPDSNLLVEYRRDLSIRFSELLQEFRLRALRAVLNDVQ